MKNKSIVSLLCIGTLSLSVICVAVFSIDSNIALMHLGAEQDLYTLSLNESNPFSGGNEYVATTHSGNHISFYGENISAGSSNNYFLKMSALNNGYFGNGRASGIQYENALSKLEYITVNLSSDVNEKAAGTLTLTTGIDASHSFERHYLVSGNTIQLNTPANYFRITADKVFNEDADDILIESIELKYSASCATGEYADTYGLAPVRQNRFSSLQIWQLDLSAYEGVLTPGNYTPEDLSAIKYTPFGKEQINLSIKSDDFLTLETSHCYLDFNSGWLSRALTDQGFVGYSAFNDGDILTIEGTFVGTSSDNLGQKFYIPRSDFIVKNIDGQNYIYNYLPIELINTETGSWFENRGLQFYTYDNFLDEANDIKNVGKLKTYKKDALTLKRYGYPFGIGKDNSGWYSLYKTAKKGGTLYQLEFYQSSIDFGAATSLQSGDTIVFDGLFIANTNDLVYINGHSAKFTYRDSWQVEEVDEIKDDTSTPGTMNIGIWNGNYHFMDISKLETAAALGINVIVGVNPVWNSNWTTILNKTQELGIKFIVDPRPYDSNLGGYGSWDGTCPSYANHPAVMGFFMMDEPCSTQFSNLQSVKEQFDDVMPNDKIFFSNLFSGACGLESLYGPGSYSDSDAFYYEDRYVNNYASTVDADMYGFDTYALFNDGYVRKSYFCDFDVWSYRSKLDDKPLWYTHLLSSHNSGDNKTYINPDKSVLRWQTSIGLTYGVDSFLGYIYAHDNDGDYNAIANNNGNIINQTLYDDYQTVVQEYRNWEKEYKNYIWQGTTSYDTGSANMMFQNLKHKVDLSTYSLSLSSNQDLLVGAFKNKYTGNNAYMITNAGNAPQNGYYSLSKYNCNLPITHSQATVTLNFGDVYQGVYVYEDGVKTYYEINSNSYVCTINQLDGIFVVPTND